MARGPTYPVAPEKIIVAAKSLFTCFRITTAHSPTRKRAIHAACLWVRPGFGVATHAPVQFCTPALFLVGPGHLRGPGYGRFQGGSWAYHSPQWPVRIRGIRPTQANPSFPFGRVSDNSPTREATGERGSNPPVLAPRRTAAQILFSLVCEPVTRQLPSVLEPAAGFEPATSGLQVRCSTAELHRLWSGWAESNPHPRRGRPVLYH